MSFKTYSLSDEKILKIARLCVQEQGSTQGVRAEASQAANLLETNSRYRKEYGSDIYSFMRNSGWYSQAPKYMDNGSASAAAVDAVHDVLCEGLRIFPQYVDEHDCIGDISSISTGSKYNKDDFIKGKTIIRNRYGGVYTFYSFPAPGSDPFGYTASAYEYVKEHGGGDDPEPGDDKVKVTCYLPELYQDCPKSEAVQLWRWLMGENPNYKTFKSKLAKITKQWQAENGLTADGIVGAKTWAAALNDLE